MGNRLTGLFAFAGLLIWAGAHIAAAETDHICFHRIDADRNGKVTFQEFADHYDKAEKKFSSADKNGDGVLTHDEYHDFLGHGAPERTSN